MLTRTHLWKFHRDSRLILPRRRGILYGASGVSFGIVPVLDAREGLVIHITADTVDVNMRTLFGNPTYSGIFTIYIDSGIAIGSTSTATPAFTTGSGWGPNSVLRLKNYGFVDGLGGIGGAGANGQAGGNANGGSAGANGGDALAALVLLRMWNFGSLRAGGGGGGGGQAISGMNGIGDCNGGGGGGGGGAGRGNSSPGAAGAQDFVSNGGNVALGSNPGSGSQGTTTGGGASGPGGSESAVGGRFSQGGSGGTGGGFGQSGASGNGASGVNDSQNFAGPHAGGGPGKATSIGSSIIWMASGTIIGALG